MVKLRSLIRRSCGLSVEAGDGLHAAPSGMRARARRVAGSMMAAGIFLVAAAHGQTLGLVTVDDVFSVPFGQDLVAEAPGVLTNDLFDGEPAEDGGATAVLVDPVRYGTLSCDDPPAGDPALYDLCPNGSFTYTPGASFPGFDGFNYQPGDFR